MRNKLLKISILLVITGIINNPVSAESLFRTGVSENTYTIQPRSLFSTVRARI